MPGDGCPMSVSSVAKRHEGISRPIYPGSRCPCPQAPPDVKRDIRAGIRVLSDRPLEGHPLQYELSGYRSYRIRTYRVIYHLNETERTLDVIFVGPRRDVYEELRAYLLSALDRHG